MGQESLAADCGFKQGWISEIESGRKAIKSRTIDAILDAFKMSVREMLGSATLATMARKPLADLPASKPIKPRRPKGEPRVTLSTRVSEVRAARKKQTKTAPAPAHPAPIRKAP